MKKDIGVTELSLEPAALEMSKSNPSALNGLLQKQGRNHPHPESPFDGTSRFAGNQGHHGGAEQPLGTDNSHQWSEGTFTGSSRCSAYSWALDEAELDRVAAESVRKKFDGINSFLFEGKSTGMGRVDDECKEWSGTFPHFEVKGLHMLDTMEDGTEMVTPDPLLDIPAHHTETIGSEGDGGVAPRQEENKLMVIGQKAVPVAMELDKDEDSPLYEEVFVEDGILEEYFAYDKTEEVGPHSSDKSGRWRHHRHAVPPITPSACVRDAVMDAAFSHVWGEVIAVLHPLLDAIRENSQAAQDSNFSMDHTLTPTEPNDSPQEKLLPEISHPPNYGKTFGQADPKFPRWKFTAPSVPSNHGGPSSSSSSYGPMAANNLSGVMQIRPMALQQRGHASFAPSLLPVGANSREGTPLYPLNNDRPVSGLTAPRLNKLSTPLPPRSDFLIPPTPSSTTLVSNRLASSHFTSRRNINTAILRPIEKPKTPGLAPMPMDSGGIRGFRLGVNSLQPYSPPTTPMVRHSQLPPLEVSSTSHSSAIGGSRIPPSYSYPSSDRSPTTQHRISAQQRGRVTFNSRVASAATDDHESWNYGGRGMSGAAITGGELRPSTTNIALRPIEGQVKSSHGIPRKVSESSSFYGRMKVVGHATGVHGGGGGGALGGAFGGGGALGGAFGGGGEVIYGIEEDDELTDQARSFTVTGKSGIVQTKPHSVSTKTKSRSQFR